MERVTFQKPHAGEDDTLKEAVFFQCVLGILRTGGIKTAGVHQKGGDKPLIENYECYEQPFEHFKFRMQSTAFCSSWRTS